MTINNLSFMIKVRGVYLADISHGFIWEYIQPNPLKTLSRDSVTFVYKGLRSFDFFLDTKPDTKNIGIFFTDLTSHWKNKVFILYLKYLIKKHGYFYLEYVYFHTLGYYLHIIFCVFYF